MTMQASRRHLCHGWSSTRRAFPPPTTTPRCSSCRPSAAPASSRLPISSSSGSGTRCCWSTPTSQCCPSSPSAAGPRRDSDPVTDAWFFGAVGLSGDWPQGCDPAGNRAGGGNRHRTRAVHPERHAAAHEAGQCLVQSVLPGAAIYWQVGGVDLPRRPSSPAAVAENTNTGPGSQVRGVCKAG